MELLNYGNLNVKLNKQLNELKKCNAEISEIFKDLNYVNLTSSSSLSSSSQSVHTPKSGVHNHELYLINHCCHSRCSCSSDESFSDYAPAQVVKPKREKKPKKQIKQYKPARIQFRYKLPYASTDFEATRSCANLDDLIQTAVENEKSENYYTLSSQSPPARSKPPPRSNSVNSTKRKDSLKKPIKYAFADMKPTWVPNGKFKHAKNLVRSQSSQSLASTKSISSIKSANSKLENPWRPNGKIKHNDPILFSQETLNIDRSNLVNKKKKHQLFDPKDVGKGWKVSSKIEIKDELLKSTDLEIKPQEKEVKKKLNFKDEKDVGSGWKVTAKIDFKDELLKSTNIELKQPEQKQAVKKKITFKDEKDIGDGWKPILGKTKSTEFLLYSQKEPVSVETSKDSDKKKEKSVRDLGKGWKPTGQTHLKNKDLLDKVVFYKPPTPENSDKPKRVIKQETVDLRKSAPSSPWKPAMSKLKVTNPNTWSPGLRKSINKNKPNAKPNIIDKLKKEEDFITSTPKEGTPNRSKDEMDKNSKLDESIIEKTTDRKDVDNLSNNEDFKNIELQTSKREEQTAATNSLNTKKEETSKMNDKIQDDDDLIDEIEEIKDDEPKQVDEIKNESNHSNDNKKRETSQKESDKLSDEEEDEIKLNEEEEEKKDDSDEEKQFWNIKADDEDEE